MHMPRGHKPRARMLAQDRGERLGVAEILRVHVTNAGRKWRMMQEQQRRARRGDGKRGLEPGERRCVEFAMRRAGHAGIEKQHIEAADGMDGIERAVRLRIAETGKCPAHQRAVVVVTGDGDEGDLQRRKQRLQVFVFFLGWGVAKIAGDHHQIGPRRKAIEFRNAAGQRRRGIDAAIGKRPRLLDVQVGNLGDEDRAVHWPSGNRRIAAGSTANPTRSPALTASEFGTSTRIAVAAAPAHHQPLPVADEAHAIDAAGKPGSLGRDDADRFRPDHRGRRAGALRGTVSERERATGEVEAAAGTLALDDVGGADEFGDEAACRREVDIARAADLGDGALAHHHDAVAERHGFGLVVGDVNGGDAEHAQQPVKLAAQPFAQRGVERRQRLVEQQHAGAHCDGAGQGHALTLSAGQLINAPVFEALDAGELDQFGNARFPFGLAEPRILSP